MVSKEFMEIIEQDIQKCENALSAGKQESNSQLHNTLISKYGKIIDGFSDDLLSRYFDDDCSNMMQNIDTMKQKLLLFKAMGYENRYSEKHEGIHIENTNKVSVKITTTFPEAREKIEGMTSLKDSDIDEILEKINELERIVKSTDRKSKKWANAGEIIKWIADKGIDVGLTLLPLLMQIGE